MSQGIRNNTGKPQWSQIDFKSLEPMVRVLEYGEAKVGRDNWKKGLLVRETIESLLRHAFSLLEGEDNDKESGLPHIGHILSNAMFISYMLQNRPDMDNRKNEVKGGVLSDQISEMNERIREFNRKIEESAKKRGDDGLVFVVAGCPIQVDGSTGEALDKSNYRQVVDDFANWLKYYKEEMPGIVNTDPPHRSHEKTTNAKVGAQYPREKKCPDAKILAALISEGYFDPSDSRPIMDEILTSEVTISGQPIGTMIRLPAGITMRDALFRVEYCKKVA